MSNLSPLSPLELSGRLSAEYGAKIWIKRDDLFPFSGGGSKARKAQFIFPEAARQGCNAIVTTGSAQSNHIRVCALMAAQLGWKAHIIIHDTKPSRSHGNHFLTVLSGAEITYCDMPDVASEMDRAMESLAANGHKPFYIWGGGHNLQGSYAYYDAVRELREQWPVEHQPPDYVIFASGTGTTQAGMHAGLARWSSSIKCIGVSVARQNPRGTQEVKKALMELNDYIADGLECPSVRFDDQFNFGGYAQTDTELENFVTETAQTTGLLVDPVYTGKALFALKSYIKSGEISKGSKVLFWHTGGLLNLLP